jgi:hypothetical protein
MIAAELVAAFMIDVIIVLPRGRSVPPERTRAPLAAVAADAEQYAEARQKRFAKSIGYG